MRTERTVVVIVLLSALAAVQMPAPARADLTVVEPGFTFTLSSGFANLTFAQSQTFQNWSLPDGHTICFNSVCLSVQKYPASFPSVAVNFTAWNPTVFFGVAAQWTSTVASATAVWFNWTGLVGGLQYNMYVGGSSARAPGTGSSFQSSWSNWPSSAPFVLEILPAGNSGATTMSCSSQYLFFGAQVACSSTDLLAWQYQWYVNGVLAGQGARMSAYVWSLGLNGTATVQVFSPVNGAIGPNASFVQVGSRVLSWSSMLNVGFVFLFLGVFFAAFAWRDYKASRRRGADAQHFSHGYRSTAIAKERIGDYVSYRQLDPAQITPGTYVTLRIPGAKDHPPLLVIRGRHKDTGAMVTQTVREYRPLDKEA